MIITSIPWCLAPLCLRRPVSYEELIAITGFPDDTLASALGELNRLFLISKPLLIEGEDRYDLNVNTRRIVQLLLRGSDLYRRIEQATKAVTGELPRVGHGEISRVVRQAVLLVKSDEHVRAETGLKEALTRFPEDPDLIAFLGWVYKCWKPPRVTDAREKFKRAHQLNCRNEAFFYEHWSRLEAGLGEWTASAKAAERGLHRLPGSHRLHRSAGYARGRLAQELERALQREKAGDEFARSIEHYEKALRDPEDLPSGERSLNADVYRGLVLNYAALDDFVNVKNYFSRWLGEHPDDQRAITEWKRLSRRFDL